MVVLRVINGNLVGGLELALAQNRDRRAASLADVWEVVTQCLVHPNDRYAVQTTMVMSMQWGSGVCGH